MNIKIPLENRKIRPHILELEPNSVDVFPDATLQKS